VGLRVIPHQLSGDAVDLEAQLARGRNDEHPRACTHATRTIVR
jgi:hypothetical protein